MNKVISTKYGNAGIDSNGYYKITTKQEGNFEKYLHRLIYEEHYGEIPKGHIVHHKNENKLDNRIENLELMTKKEHTILHSTGNTYWLGKKHTKETKDKISKAHMGKKYSAERIEQMRVMSSGKNNPMYGKHHSKETKKKISNARTKKYARIIKAGKSNGKQRYGVKKESKILKSNADIGLLVNWFTFNYPNTILRIGPIEV